LWGENPITVEVQQKGAEGSKDSAPRKEGHQDGEEQTKSSKPKIKTPDPSKNQNPVTTPGHLTKQIEDPITSITPLQSTQRNINTGCIFNGELRPIRMKELPPNEFFFHKKRKGVVKREFYQEEGSTTKNFKVLTDGKDKKKEEFSTEIVGTLGSYATANQFSVGVLKNQLK
jgi:hypothetical protein